MSRIESPTYLKLSNVRLSYAHVWEPASIGNEANSTPKYSASIIIPKSNKKALADFEKAVKAAIEEGKHKKFNGKTPPLGALKLPLRDGDVERPDDEAYAGCMFFNASSKNRPQIVDQNVQPVMDRAEVYSGCYVNISVNLYAFNTNGNRGVAAGLGNIQKLRDGEPLGGVALRAEDEFETVSFDAAEENDFLN